MKRAIFAVVGHPNKGKSSIVSTLSRNDSIEISTRSGTTSHSGRYRVETAHSGYELVDTPGFQRPRKVLAWLNKNSPGADQRAKTIAEFIEDPQCRQNFPDEVELLSPIVKGAAILYVVDGSRPYDAEYDAEMEILRWTGQPSMALINPIENEKHVDSWSQALAQYFKTVRIFNPMEADFSKQIELLKVFSHLNPNWAATLNALTDDLQQQRLAQKNKAALLLARLVEDLCFYRESQKVLTEQQAKVAQPLLEQKYKAWMVAREEKGIRELMANYAHFQVDFSIDDLSLPPDLFDCDQWYMWGLDKQQLATASAVAGAAAGAAVDLAVAGHSFMLGAIGGGLVGFGSAWFGAGKLVDVKLKGLPLGGFEACYGPVKNKNFPYVVIGRFIHIYNQVSDRNHAKRGRLEVLATDFQQKVMTLEKSSQKALHQACDKLVKQKTVDDLANILLALF
ncbi:GTPase/DUF3482 domain-containing protein [Aliikangiella coralliicola]|uniref:DUF3482 domain-containing protein n=1 Tax=Aliikangiella coralliicola TaxID=2592383 RepID=A0A545UHU8_9GAMM|nr:GTPase/DUF3482 domain-containing protein [Aliikangiella coralliicola]TQV89029.1 DUF3482 domain-containing protein [Aliikangiella coralliicola]